MSKHGRSLSSDSTTQVQEEEVSKHQKTHWRALTPTTQALLKIEDGRDLIQKNVDALAWLLEGSHICTTVYFDTTNTLYVTTNDLHNTTGYDAAEWIDKVLTYFQDLGGDSKSSEQLRQNTFLLVCNKTLNALNISKSLGKLNPKIQEQWIEYFYQYLDDDEEILSLAKLPPDQLLLKITHCQQLKKDHQTKLALNYAYITRKTLRQVRKKFLMIEESVKKGGVLHAAFQKIDLKSKQGTAVKRIDQPDVHAEMRALSYLLQETRYDIRAFPKSVYLGISKRCCPHCSAVIIAIQKMLLKNKGVNTSQAEETLMDVAFQLKVAGFHGVEGHKKWVPPLFFKHCLEITRAYETSFQKISDYLGETIQDMQHSSSESNLSKTSSRHYSEVLSLKKMKLAAIELSHPERQKLLDYMDNLNKFADSLRKLSDNQDFYNAANRYTQQDNSSVALLVQQATEQAVKEHLAEEAASFFDAITPEERKLILEKFIENENRLDAAWNQTVWGYCKSILQAFLFAYHQNELIQLEEKLTSVISSPYSVGRLLTQDGKSDENYPQRFFLRLTVNAVQQDNYSYTIHLHFPQEFNENKETIIKTLCDQLKLEKQRLSESQPYLEVQGKQPLSAETIKALSPVFQQAKEFLDNVTDHYIQALRNTDQNVIWGGNTELGMIAQVLGLQTINVYDRRHVFLLSCENNLEGQGHINLQRIGDNHYHCYIGDNVSAAGLIPIDGDGNCMFAAALMAHNLDLVSDPQDRLQAIQNLRRAVAHAIQEKIKAEPYLISYQFQLLFDAENEAQFNYRLGDLPPGFLRDEAQQIHAEIRKVLIAQRPNLPLIQWQLDQMKAPEHELSPQQKQSKESQSNDVYATQNAWQYSNDPDYLYQGTDIDYIGRQIFQFMGDVTWVGGLGLGRNSRMLNAKKILSKAVEEQQQKERPIIGVFNVDGFHWIAFGICMIQNQCVVFYKDSLPGRDLSKQFRQLIQEKYGMQTEFVEHPANSNEQQDGVSCGLFALENARKIANTLPELLQQQEVSQMQQAFKQLEFTQQTGVPRLREHFGALYAIEDAKRLEDSYTANELVKQIRSAQVENLNHIVEAFQQQNITVVLLDQVEKKSLASLKNTIIMAVCLMQDGEDLMQQKAYQYFIHVQFTNDINNQSIKKQVEKILKKQGFQIQQSSNETGEVKTVPNNGDQQILQQAKEAAQQYILTLNQKEEAMEIEQLASEEDSEQSQKPTPQVTSKASAFQEAKKQKEAAEKILPEHQAAIKRMNQERMEETQEKQNKKINGISQEDGLAIQSLNQNLASIITANQSNPTFYFSSTLMNSKQLLSDLENWQHNSDAPYYGGIIKVKNEQGHRHAVVVRAVKLQDRGIKITLIDPMTQADSTFQVAVHLLAEQMSAIGTTDVVYAGRQDKDYGTCGDMSLILLQEWLEQLQTAPAQMKQLSKIGAGFKLFDVPAASAIQHEEGEEEAQQLQFG